MQQATLYGIQSNATAGPSAAHKAVPYDLNTRAGLCRAETASRCFESHNFAQEAE